MEGATIEKLGLKRRLLISKIARQTLLNNEVYNRILMSLEDDKALEETVFILSNPNNAKHTLSSLAELREGKG